MWKLLLAASLTARGTLAQSYLGHMRALSVDVESVLSAGQHAELRGWALEAPDDGSMHHQV